MLLICLNLGPTHTWRRVGAFSVAALLAVFANGCSRSPQAQRAYNIERGDRYVAQGKLPEAIIEYRSALQADPQSGDAQLKLADAYAKAGDWGTAAGAYVRAADLLSGRLDVQLRAGSLLLLGGRFDDAKVRAEKALAISPGDIDSHVLLANALAGLRSPEEAIAQVEEAIQLDPGRASTYTSLATIEIARGRADAAERAFRKALELDEKSTIAHLAIANFFWAGGRLPEAERELKRALELEPSNIIGQKSMAAFLISSNRADEAEVHLKKIFELTNAPAAALALADFHLARRDERAARAVLEPLKDRPDLKAEVRLRLASLDHAAGRRDQAYRAIDEVIAADRRNLHALLGKATLLLSDGRNDDALAAVNLAIEANQDSAAAYYTLGQIQTARKQLDLAVAAYDNTIRLNPRAVAAKVGLAQLHLIAGRSQTSVAFAQDALRSEPGNPDARLVLIKGLVAKGDLPEATTQVQDLAARYPTSAAVLVQKGILQAHNKNTAAARATFEEARRLDPSSIEALAGLVALNLAAKEPELARARIDEELKRPERSADLLMLAGRTYFAINDRKTAEQYFRRVLERDPAYFQAYIALGQLYIVDRRLDEALAEFDALAQRDPRSVAPLTFAGVILQAQGRTAEARDRFERALQVDPAAAVAANNLAWIYSESGGNLDIALQLARTARAKLPDVPEVNDTLGYIYYKKNLLPQAIEALHAAVQRDPGNPSYHFHLGLALAKAGNGPDATVHLTQALNLKSDFDGAAEARSVLQTLPTR